MLTLYIFLIVIHLAIVLVVDSYTFPNTSTRGKSYSQICAANHYQQVFSKNFPVLSDIYVLFSYGPFLYYILYNLLSNNYSINFTSIVPFFWVLFFSSFALVFLYLITVENYHCRDAEMRRLKPNFGIFLFIYIYAASVLSGLTTVHFLNYALDFFKGEEKVVTITKKDLKVSEKRKGKSYHYYVYFTPSIGGLKSFDNVSASFYDDAVVGDIIKVMVKKGFLGMPYVKNSNTVIRKGDYEREELENNLSSRNIDDIVSLLIENMVECPAGTFIMGNKKEGSDHQVTITKPFYIGKYEVTQKEYTSIMGKNPSAFIDDDNPVEVVSWVDAKSFCDYLNKYGKGIPVGYRFDLPTEAQWEYACRAGTNTDLNSGKNIISVGKRCDSLGELAWYEYNSDKTTHQVGQKEPNAWGIYDMHGNVYEWCRDYYRRNYSGDEIDPCNSEPADDFWVKFRVIRGGSYCVHGYLDPVKICTSYSRVQYNENIGVGFIGFRLALVSDDSSSDKK